MVEPLITPKACHYRLAQLKKFPLIDIGAESTAPVNAPIGGHLELRRFWQLGNPHLNDNHLVSIDTYRVATFRMLQDRSTRPFIFNDVSGSLDNDLATVLKQFPRSPYIFCHNLAPHREQTSYHMHYLYRGGERGFWEHMQRYFHRAYRFWQEYQLTNPLLFDLGFGFSKTYEQNWFLLEHLPEFLHQFPLEQVWVIGISRKSFLRRRADELETPHEVLHRKMIQRLRQLSRRFLIFRIHDGEIFSPELKG